jgi:hypothetical protein
MRLACYCIFAIAIADKKYGGMKGLEVAGRKE